MLRVYDLRAVGFSCKSYPGTIVTTFAREIRSGADTPYGRSSLYAYAEQLVVHTDQMTLPLRSADQSVQSAQTTLSATPVMQWNVYVFSTTSKCRRAG